MWRRRTSFILAADFRKFRKNQKKSDTSKVLRERVKETAILGDFSGQLMISIKSLDSADEEFPPFFRRLDPEKKQITLYELLSELPEFKETENLTFLPGTEKGIVLRNNSKCTVEKNTVKIDIGRVVKIQNEEKISVALGKTSKEINIQYFARE